MISEKADNLVERFESESKYYDGEDNSSLNQARVTLRDYIASLESQLAELQARLAWIPVSERLPEEYRDEETRELIPFLVCEVNGGYPFRAVYDGVNWGDGMFKAAVTHWMPLPEAPKEDE